MEKSNDYYRTVQKPELEAAVEQEPGFELFSGIIVLMLVLIKRRY